VLAEGIVVDAHHARLDDVDEAFEVVVVALGAQQLRGNVIGQQVDVGEAAGVVRLQGGDDGCQGSERLGGRLVGDDVAVERRRVAIRRDHRGGERGGVGCAGGGGVER
jgi:hypothetical protein